MGVDVTGTAVQEAGQALTAASRSRRHDSPRHECADLAGAGSRTQPRPAPGRSAAVRLAGALLLELQFLIEAGRIRLREGTLEHLAEDDRWLLDDPPAAAWFRRAIDLSWTRDPFDRLLVAHARYRGWRLATADTTLLKRLKASERLEL